MEVLLTIIGIALFLLLYVSIKVSKDIKQSRSTTSQERKMAYLLVWSIPFLGIIFVSKKILPRFYKDENGNSYTIESGGGFPGGG